jgi:hypothetical protein
VYTATGDETVTVEAKLIELGNALARSLGHKPVGGSAYTCPKISSTVPCTCGAGREQAKALDDWQHFLLTK